MTSVSTRRAAATIHQHPGNAVLASMSAVIDEDHAAPAVLLALSRLWAEQLPAVVAWAQPESRFTFAVSIQRGADTEVDVYVSQGLALPALVRTLAHKLERQKTTVARLAPMPLPHVTEVAEGSAAALQVLRTLATVRRAEPIVDVWVGEPRAY